MALHDIEKEIMKPKTNFTEESLARVVREFENQDSIVPYLAHEVHAPLSLDSSSMLFARLQRAAGNQISEGSSTLSRYVIWAETVRGIILHAIDDIPSDSDTRRNLTKAANSLAAFCTIQEKIDFST
jgi:hypothetical protein